MLANAPRCPKPSLMRLCAYLRQLHPIHENTDGETQRNYEALVNLACSRRLGGGIEKYTRDHRQNRSTIVLQTRTE